MLATQDEIREIERRVHIEADADECRERTGQAPIKVWWGDVCKFDGTKRRRSVAKGLVGGIDGLFASMTPLEQVKLLLGAAAKFCRRDRLQKIMPNDIGKAHLTAPVEGDVYIELPPECYREGVCEKLRHTLHGTQVATSKWEKKKGRKDTR